MLLEVAIKTGSIKRLNVLKTCHWPMLRNRIHGIGECYKCLQNGLLFISIYKTLEVATFNIYENTIGHQSYYVTTRPSQHVALGHYQKTIMRHRPCHCKVWKTSSMVFGSWLYQSARAIPFSQNLDNNWTRLNKLQS